MASIPLSDRRPVVISGPSGVGKGTLSQKLFDTSQHIHIKRVSYNAQSACRRSREVSITSSSPRPRSLLSSLKVPSSSTRTLEATYYGTSKKTIADQTARGLVVVLDIEMHGIKQMKVNYSIDMRYVFIKPPNFETLEARLRSRGTENEEQIQGRLSQAKVELEYADKPGAYDKIIINDNLEKAYEELNEFIFRPAPQNGNAVG